ncbi:MAG: PPE family protein [Mycobacteriaceae bacterium]|nr:PPE family protein [Mycobacteriaceae bacterium]
MYYAMLPPEVNSTRMYSGPGASSLQVAATTWSQLSADLQTTAESYGAVLSGLASLQWLGQSSASMMAAVTPYVEWLAATGAQAQQTATQAMAAAAAYETAYALTIPPEAVFANRSALTTLVATNFFGQNSVAIAANEAAYAEMWAQDATAMNGYATSSAAAWKLTQYTPPPAATNPAATLSTALAEATDPIPPTPWWVPFVEDLLRHIFGVGDYFGITDGVFFYYAMMSSINDTISATSSVLGDESTLGLIPGAAADLAPTTSNLIPPPGDFLSASSRATSATLASEVTAAMRNSGTIGQMSVPASWAAPATTAAKEFSHTPLTTLPTTEPLESGMPGMPGMPIPGSGRGGVVPRYGTRLTVMSRPLSGG